MQILFKNESARKQFSSEYRKKWRYPEQVKVKLLAAENYILRADSLMDIVAYPPYHFEHLRGDRNKEWSIRLGNTGYRVTLVPCDDNGEELVGGDILAKSRTIRVIEVTEVSNHYE